jgi:uncharacterized protein YxeA
MKRLITTVFALFLLFQCSVVGAQPTDYEKYGKIAIAAVQADYSGEPVTEYQYQGRKDLGNGQVEDSFLFVVKEQGKAKRLIVRVRHNTRTQKLLNLTVEEQGAPSQR